MDSQLEAEAAPTDKHWLGNWAALIGAVIVLVATARLWGPDACALVIGGTLMTIGSRAPTQRSA